MRSCLIIIFSILGGFVQSQDITITPRYYNFLYRGIDHKFTINSNIKDCSRIEIFPSEGEITKDSCQFSIRIGSTHNSFIWIYIGITDSMGTEWTDSLYYRIKNIPKPIPTIAEKHSGYIDLEIIRKKHSIIPRLQNFDFDTWMKIYNYSIVIIRKGEEYYKKEDIDGNRIYKEVIDVLKKGDVILVYSIKCISTDRIKNTLENITLIIK